MPQDILLDDNWDLAEENGDLVVDDATAQHKGIILLAQKGEIRQFPFVGVGIRDYILDDDLGDLAQAIQKQFELDGMTIDRLEVFNNGNIEEKAYYEDS
jgi:hypothetical protein